MTVYATLADVDARYPQQLAQLAADETTGVRDDARIDAVLIDVSSEIDSLLLARYRRDELARLDEPSLALLRSYAIAMSLYKVALSFSRSSERVQAAYDGAVTSLRAIGKGGGALTFDPDPSAQPVATTPGEAAGGNTSVLFEADERVFTRRRTRGL